MRRLQVTTKEELTRNGESGQTLPLFGLFITTLLLFALAVVDVGFFLHERQQVQAAADAAALAGAQELPDSTTNAQNVALEYLTKNGIPTDGVTISFRCTSGQAAICNGTTTFDTIVVKPRSQSPEFFGGILSMIGAESCWINGCNVSAQAAGCRGACGPIGNGPADIMVMLDHSYSMSTTDLANAKNATVQMFTDLNNQYQKVGLAVTPPVNPGNTCDAIDHWADAKQWMPAGLTFDFQTSPHVLNTASGPVYQTNCVDRTDFSSPNELTDYPFCSCHTDVGSGIQAAANELNTNGRIVDSTGSAVVHGMIIVTDGAANVAPFTTTTTTTTNGGNTGYNFCGSVAAVTSGSGDNNGIESNGTSGRLCASDNSRGVDNNSGSGTSTNCSSSQKDRHTFSGFNHDNEISGSAAITGVEVQVEASANATTRQICVDYSVNGGSSYTSLGTINLTGSEATYTVGNSSNLTGLGLGDNDFDNSFVVRLTMVSSNTGTDFTIDAVSARVSYTTSSTSTTNAFNTGILGPCHWAAQQADAAKAAGIEIYVIGFGVSTTEQCNDFSELSTSPYYNTYSTAFLCSLATDADHCYNEPKTEDLEPVFQEIGAQLVAKGSKLVE
jgi:hypothetical protein